MPEDTPIRIHILRCGSITVAEEVLGGGKGFYLPQVRSMTPMSRRVELPVLCFLIEHPRGRILIDAGLCREISPEGKYSARDAAAVLGPSLASFYHPVLPRGEAIDEQLRALGLAPSDIDYVFITHLDADHVCGARALRDAGHVICSQEEYWWSCRTAYRLRQPERLWLEDRPETFWFKGTVLGPSLWSKDFFDDGSFTLIHMPGHTEGQFGALLRRGERFAIFTADAAYESRSWRELRVPGFGFNPEAQMKCLRWIRDMSADKGCAAVLASHDRGLSPGLIEL